MQKYGFSENSHAIIMLNILKADGKAASHLHAERTKNTLW